MLRSYVSGSMWLVPLFALLVFMLFHRVVRAIGSWLVAHAPCGLSIRDELAFIQADNPTAQGLDGGHIMADKQYCPSRFCHVSHFPQTFFLKGSIAHREHFIHQQHFRFHV